MKTKVFVVSLLIGSMAAGGGGSSVGPSNPAAENCIKLQGTLESFEDNAGQGANCVVDEWHLWREMERRGLVKHHEEPTPPYGLANPASVNCQDIGGEIRWVETLEGTQGFCVVGEWKLFEAINVLD
ncbi:MAG: DUF333 domain-containing protein [Bdellovibrionaceae bacterium]|nr:DUF333 domain-containing protein [Pseudobdellovibrionaceae bacterium]